MSASPVLKRWLPWPRSAFTSTPGDGQLKLRRIGKRGEKQTLTIPLHADLDPGTVRAIMRQAARYIPETELQPHFFSE